MTHFVHGEQATMAENSPWQVAGDFETHCVECHRTWRPLRYGPQHNEGCSYYDYVPPTGSASRSEGI